MSISLNLQLKGLAISTVLIALILIIEVFVRDDIFNFSLPIIHSLQQSLPRGVSYYIFFAAASLANPEYVIITFLLIMSLQVNKYFLVKVGIYVCFVAYILSLMKTIYASPRPYWVRPHIKGLPGYVEGEEIEPFEKYAEYGNPSGHAFFTIALYGYLFYFFTVQHKRNVRRYSDITIPLNPREGVDYYAAEDVKNVSIPAEEAAGFQTQPSPPMSRNKYIAMNVVFFVTMFLVCMSRLYLGMHAINQVCLGLCLGTYIMYVFVNFIDERLENFLKAIAKQELPNRPLTIWSLGVCYLLVTLLPIALFMHNSSKYPVPESETWKNWWIVVSTELPKNSKGSFAYIRCFLDSGVIGGFFGILIGCLASDGSYTETAPKISSIPKIKLFFRVIVFFLASGIVPGLLYLIPIPSQNFILQYFIRFNLALFSAGFGCMKFVPMAYNKLDLEMEGDFMKVRKVILTEKVEKSLSTKGP